MTTKCIMRKFRDYTDDVIAIFPEIRCGGLVCQSYQHAGQHGVFYSGTIYQTVPATAEEYQPLARELVGQGYNLHIVGNGVADHVISKWIETGNIGPSSTAIVKKINTTEFFVAPVQWVCPSCRKQCNGDDEIPNPGEVVYCDHCDSCFEVTAGKSPATLGEIKAALQAAHDTILMSNKNGCRSHQMVSDVLNRFPEE